jgi:pathogenesis-related protein 1
MRIALLLLAWSLGTACSDGESLSDAGTGSNAESPELMGTLAAHNQVRQQVGLPALTWDPALEATAKAWVSKCEDRDGNGLVDHNDDRSPPDFYVGENIYGATRGATGPAAVNAWAAEAANYNYSSNTCTGVCGHYTQLVWRETTRVGCALYECASLRFVSTVVCDYAPGGNVNDRRPY